MDKQTTNTPDTTAREKDNTQEQGDIKNQQAVDKAPGEERGKGNQLTQGDLKGKQVDADPSTEAGKPLDQQ